jgi:prevent-host-death family protein
MWPHPEVPMKIIGVRHLKERLNEVLREVRQHDEEFIVTVHGRPIAKLVPVGPGSETNFDEGLWSEMDRLADEIGREWTSTTGAADAVSADRGDT